MDYLISEDDIYSKKNFQVIYFYGTWMNYHKKFCNMISSFEEKNKNFYFLAVDVDKFRPVANRFEVKSIPCLVVLHKDKEVKKCNGMLLTSAFKSFLNDIYEEYKEK